jgi:membrane-bound serine protease (ClpP class)
MFSSAAEFLPPMRAAMRLFLLGSRFPRRARGRTGTIRNLQTSKTVRTSMSEASRTRLVLGLAALTALGSLGLLAAGFLAGKGRDRSSPADGAVVFRIPVHGVIELGLAPFVARSLREAAASDARAAILDIETPGGRVDAAEQIVDALKNADVPVYAFVNRRAFSAGALISLATDNIYMRPGSVIGAATPVTGEGQKAPEKIVSAMRSEMRALAEDRKLDPRVAEGMVDEEIEIAGVKEKGKLLTLTTEEAVRLGYATSVEDWDALLAQLNLAGSTVHQTSVNWAEAVVRFFTHPIVAPLLLSLGFIGLVIEIKTPSFGLAGAAGIGALGLFFGSHYLVGLAGMGELLLIGGGLLLLAIEMFVLPGFGIAGIIGLLALTGGIYLSLVSSFSSAAEMAQAAGILSLSLIVLLVAVWALVRHLPRSGRRSGIMLGEATSRETGYLSAPDRAELVGATGVALTDLRPAGAARIGEERLDVTAETDWISAGSTVRVIRSDGYRHVVQKIEATS